MKSSDAAAFWKRVDRSGGADACWPWTGSLQAGGYGQFRFWVDGEERNWRAHRLAYFLEVGSLPPAPLILRHRCDFRPCCNPGHSVPGTRAQNSADMVERGRSTLGCEGLKGSGNGNAVLTERLVAEMKVRLGRGSPKKPLAREFGVSQKTVQNIAAGKTWKHVEAAA